MFVHVSFSQLSISCDKHVAAYLEFLNSPFIEILSSDFQTIVKNCPWFKLGCYNVSML